jgi:hypothetical protein
MRKLTDTGVMLRIDEEGNFTVLPKPSDLDFTEIQCKLTASQMRSLREKPQTSDDATSPIAQSALT